MILFAYFAVAAACSLVNLSKKSYSILIRWSVFPMCVFDVLMVHYSSWETDTIICNKGLPECVLMDSASIDFGNSHFPLIVAFLELRSSSWSQQARPCDSAWALISPFTRKHRKPSVLPSPEWVLTLLAVKNRFERVPSRSIFGMVWNNWLVFFSQFGKVWLWSYLILGFSLL